MAWLPLSTAARGTACFFYLITHFAACHPRCVSSVTLRAARFAFVGADAHIGPADCTVFQKIFGEFVDVKWGDVGIAPYAKIGSRQILRGSFGTAHRVTGRGGTRRARFPAACRLWLRRAVRMLFQRISQNYGLLRSRETGEILSMVPNFDMLPASENIDTMFAETFDAGLRGIDPDRAKLYRICEENDVGITVMKGFAGGRLFDEKRSPFGVRLSPVQCITTR